MLEHKKRPCLGEDCPGCPMCKGGKMYAEGGEVEEPKEGPAPEAEESEPMDDDSEMHDMIGGELMSAIESKDKKKIMETLKTAVMSCMNKRGEE